MSDLEFFGHVIDGDEVTSSDGQLVRRVEPVEARCGPAPATATATATADEDAAAAGGKLTASVR